MTDLIGISSDNHLTLRSWQHLIGKVDAPTCRLLEIEKSSGHLRSRCPVLMLERHNHQLGAGASENHLQASSVELRQEQKQQPHLWRFSTA